MVGIAMGSQSDWDTLSHAADLLKEFEIPISCHVLSAHRTPQRMLDFAKNAEQAGFRCLIAGAGGAAHLPGMLASATLLPVIGVPIHTASLGGLDSLLSIVQMPGGVPVATMAIGQAGAINAALYAARLLAVYDRSLRSKLEEYQQGMVAKVHAQDQVVKSWANP